MRGSNGKFGRVNTGLSKRAAVFPPWPLPLGVMFAALACSRHLNMMNAVPRDAAYKILPNAKNYKKHRRERARQAVI